MNKIRESWAIFSAAPHRLFFWGGASYAALSVLLWTVQLIALRTGLFPVYPWTVPYPQAHAFMMIYGLFGFYFFGFLLVTFPRWLNGENVPKKIYCSAWLSILAGSHLFWIGLYFSRPLTLIACLLLLLGYLLVLRSLVKILMLSSETSRYQQVLICLGISSGAAGIALFAWGVASGQTAAFFMSRELGISLFLLPVILSVTHRMVPFFASTVSPDYQLYRWPPALLLYALLLVARIGLVRFHLTAWSWIPDAAILAVLTLEVVQWKLWRASRPALLVVLMVGLGWIWLSFALSAGEGLYMFLTDTPARPFGQAALHALTVGGFGTLLVGISTRVTLGHSGRGLATNRLIAGIFWAFQLVPIARVAPEIAGYWVPGLAGQGFWSGLGWSAIFGLWFFLFAPVLMRPRSDGRPG